MRVCSHSACGKEFTPKTHNQRYCSDECCRVATNQRIMQRYYEKKARRKGGARACVECGSSLNRYNDGDRCLPCNDAITAGNRSELLELVGFEFSTII